MHKQKNKDIPFMLDKKHSDFIEQFNKDTKIGFKNKIVI